MQSFKNRENRKKGRGNLLYRSLHTHLRGRMLRGEFLDRGRLPTEPELAESYGVSLITVRQAQKLLVEEGLLKKRQGSGTFISSAARRKMRILWVCGVAGEAEEVHPFFMNVLRLSESECAQLGYGMEHAWIPNAIRNTPPPYDNPDALSDFIGLALVNCNEFHPILADARKLGLRHVLMGGMFPGPGSASLDLRGAIRLGLEKDGSRKTMVVTMDEKAAFVRAVARECGVRIRIIAIPSSGSYTQFEAAAYLKTRAFLVKNRGAGRYLFMEDFLARGGTRALLELGYARHKDVAVSVISGKQDVMPLGLPVKWIVHDTRKLVHEGFRILNDKLTGRKGGEDGFVNEYVTVHGYNPEP